MTDKYCRNAVVLAANECGMKNIPAAGREPALTGLSLAGNSDLILPDGMAGPELAAILQASKPTLKVVYTSGYDLQRLAKEFTLGDGVNFIPKPFHARKLAETVYDCLHGARAEKSIPATHRRSRATTRKTVMRPCGVSALSVALSP